MILDTWQREVLNYNGDFLLCTGRQVGKTTIMARKAGEHLIRNKGSKIIIVSLTEDQAKLIIVMILDYIEKHYKKEIARGKYKPTQNRVTLKNKSQAIARPVGNTGDAIRGFTGDVLIIDEGSRMPELAFTAGKPVLLTTAGQIWMCSTPFGKKGYFYESFLNRNNRFRIWHKSSENVIRDRHISDTWTDEQRTKAIKFLEDEKKDMGELEYGQEYMGLFLDDLQQFFSDELIEQVCNLKRIEGKSPILNKYMGCDIARLGGDETTIEIIQDNERGKWFHVENIVRKGLTTTKNEDLILDYDKLWNCRKIGIDAGAGTLGVSIYDHLLQHPQVKRKIIPMNNRQISMDRDGKKKQRIFKEDLYDNLRSMLERKELYLLDDSDIRLSLKSVQFEIMKETNKVSKVKIFGKYTHIVEGLTRAAWLAKKEKGLNTWFSYI